MLPEVRPSNGDFGKTPEGIPISGVLGDQQAALFAQTGMTKGMVKNTYGTGLFLMAPLSRADVSTAGRLLTTVGWALSSEKHPQYAIEGSVFTGGALLQWLRDGLGLIASASESEALARTVPDNGDVYCVPALTGLGAPYWDPYARGLLIGMTRGTTKAHIVRASLESLAYQTRDMVVAMSPALGVPLTCLRVDGGACANDWLMQFQADILGIPIDRPKVLETTAMGAAAMAGIGAGFWTLSDLPGLRHSARLFEPKMSEDERDRLYARWQSAVQRSLGWA